MLGGFCIIEKEVMGSPSPTWTKMGLVIPHIIIFFRHSHWCSIGTTGGLEALHDLLY